jgi:hypothetical protein
MTLLYLSILLHLYIFKNAQYIQSLMQIKVKIVALKTEYIAHF